jgi:hypothetical protein
MRLRDDDKACLFGTEVIRDLMVKASPSYAAFTMDIIHGERALVSIPFGPTR